MADTKGDLCRLHFRVKCNTAIGQVVGISGSSHSLGGGKKESVVVLVTTPEAHPVWYTAQPIVVPRGEAVRYRYCLLEAGSVRYFEKSGAARSDMDTSSFSNFNTNFSHSHDGTWFREFVPDGLDSTIEDNFLLDHLEGFGQDSEFELFAQMKQLTKPRPPAIEHFNSGDTADSFTPTDTRTKLYLVCYHLPLKVRRNDGTDRETEPFIVSWGESLIAKGETSIADTTNTIWVGTLSASIPVNQLSDGERSFLEAKLATMDCLPIWIPDELATAAYYGFCKKIMWPVFHNVDQLDHIHAAWNLQADYSHSFSSNTQLSSLNSQVTDSGSRNRSDSSANMAALAAAAIAACNGTNGSQGNLLNAASARPAAGRSRSNTLTGSASNNSSESNRVLEWNNMESDFHVAFEAVNRIFADVLEGLLLSTDRATEFTDSTSSKTASNNNIEGDSVWVHDYHLMLLPKLLTARLRNTDKRASLTATAAEATEQQRQTAAAMKIIFFMHIPFPTSQIFRTLPRAIELLESMCCADLIGFHAFDHARHFLNASKRMLGLASGSRPGGMIALTVRDREVIVTVSHVSIDTAYVLAALADPYTQQRAQELRDKHAGRRIILGLDVCQRLSGVALKLAAFDKMLSDSSSSWGEVGSCVLVQRCIRNGSRPGDEDTTATDLRKMVSNINTKYQKRMQMQQLKKLRDMELQDARVDRDGGDVNNIAVATANASAAAKAPLLVVDYEETQTLALRDRAAMYLAANVFLLTPIREGLNLMPLEYIFARKDLPESGAVVVSEFSTCATLLNGSYKVNPFAPLQVADAVEKALSMPAQEGEYRRQRDLPFVSSHPSWLWARNILRDLDQLRGVGTSNGNGAGATVPADSATGRSFNFYEKQFPSRLNELRMLSHYDYAARWAGICNLASRLFILDYGGTLLDKEKGDIYMKRQTLSAISGRKPTPEMLKALKKLCNDPRNIVVVMTGITKLKLGDTFRGFNNLTLLTSNGLMHSWGDNLRCQRHKNVAKKVASRKRQQHGRITAHSFDTEGDDDAEFDDDGSIANELSDQEDEENKEKRRSSGGQTLILPASVKVRDADAAASSSAHGRLPDELAVGMATDDGDGDRMWEFLDTNIDWKAVRDIANPIIRKFTFRTNGTCQTPRLPGIGWSFFGADPEWGHKQAAQLKVELEASLAKFDVKVTSLIQGSIEVVPRILDKGLLIRPILERVMRMRGGHLPGFILVMGDEESDDKTVEALYDELSGVGASAGMRQCKSFTVCVGKRRGSPAQFYVNDVQEVENLFTLLAESETTTDATNTEGGGADSAVDCDHANSHPDKVRNGGDFSNDDIASFQQVVDHAIVN